MAFNNPAVPWKEIERRLSDRPPTGRTGDMWAGDGGDSPAWSRQRPAYEAPPEPLRRQSSTPYAELHCHSNFSFLDGASHPEELVEEAARLGLEALALTDHDGFYGVVRFSEAARAVGLPTIFGSELTLLSPPAEPSPPHQAGDRCRTAPPACRSGQTRCLRLQRSWRTRCLRRWRRRRTSGTTHSWVLVERAAQPLWGLVEATQPLW